MEITVDVVKAEDHGKKGKKSKKSEQKKKSLYNMFIELSPELTSGWVCLIFMKLTISNQLQ